MSHGYQVQEGEDPVVNIVDKAVEQFSLATAPGAFLVDVLPIRAQFLSCLIRVAA